MKEYFDIYFYKLNHVIIFIYSAVIIYLCNDYISFNNIQSLFELAFWSGWFSVVINCILFDFGFFDVLVDENNVFD